MAILGDTIVKGALKILNKLSTYEITATNLGADNAELDNTIIGGKIPKSDTSY